MKTATFVIVCLASLCKRLMAVSGQRRIHLSGQYRMAEHRCVQVLLERNEMLDRGPQVLSVLPRKRYRRVERRCSME